MESPTECHDSNKFDFALEINTTGDQFIVEPSETLLVARKRTGWNIKGEMLGPMMQGRRLRLDTRYLSAALMELITVQCQYSLGE